MNSVLMTAIASSINKMVKSLPSLPVGRYRIDETVTIRVTGEVLKCDDEQYTPTVHIPVKAVLAYLLPSLGATREAQQRKLLEACKAALAADVKVAETITALVKNVDEAFKIVQNEVTGMLPDEVREGKVIVKCNIEEAGVTVQQVAPCLTPQHIVERV